jgi:membrane peptidoglycan carboxypeptidase
MLQLLTDIVRYRPRMRSSWRGVVPHIVTATRAPPLLIAGACRFFLYGALQWARALPPAWGWVVLSGLILVAVLAYESRTSSLQSYLLPRYAARLTYEIDVGPSPRIEFPHSGPYDQRLGYSLLPDFQERLDSQGFRIVEQARMAEPMTRLARRGITPPYDEAAAAGLVVHAAQGESMFDARQPQFFFDRFEDIPPLVIESLLFIENRELLVEADPRRNPAVDWRRLAKAGALYAGRLVGVGSRVEGGSTLATQIEKFRHSPGGRTPSALDKLRQLEAASLKIYREGPDTRKERRRIVVDYLNSMPLAAVADYGEVHGLGEGLHAWFGLQLDGVRGLLESPGNSDAKVRAYKQVLALLCAVRSPTHLLVDDRSALEARIASYTRLLAQAGVIDLGLAERLRATPLQFAEPPTFRTGNVTFGRKGVGAIRAQTLTLLGVPGLYELDRLHLEVNSTIDLSLQTAVNQLWRQLRDLEFLRTHALRGERLMAQGDPQDVVYSLLLYEATPHGNLLRVHADSLDQPFDLNTGMKMELGSTAKLRTLAHYLEIVAGLHEELVRRATTHRASELPRDPLTRWAEQTFAHDPTISLDDFLRAALERRYSASPSETFFTGGGAHLFSNFDMRDNGRVLSVRTALIHSTNLVFIRLMRDLVRFHAARLPFDTDAVLTDTNHPSRRRLLEAAADEEAMLTLKRAYRRYHGLSESEAVQRLLGDRVSPRRLAMVFYAWHAGADEAALARWFGEHEHPVSMTEASRLARAYSNPRLNLADYGYLLGVHPLEIWCAGEFVRSPAVPFEELVARAGPAKRVSSAWLFQTRNRNAQNLRLRIRIEREAFARMTPHWQRQGFPFEHLVPSYATAIGSSSDRPIALADLMGIILNDGARRPSVLIERLRFAEGTPYHTVFEAEPAAGEQVMNPAVAGVLRGALAEVVEEGTGRRFRSALHWPDGTAVTVGGKTGSGDNRYETFTPAGHLSSSRVVNRTATFVFYIGDRYFGVITAAVDGPIAREYRFTSALPIAVLKLLGPQLEQRLASQFPGDA